MIDVDASLAPHTGDASTTTPTQGRNVTTIEVEVVDVGADYSVTRVALVRGDQFVQVGMFDSRATAVDPVASARLARDHARRIAAITDLEVVEKSRIP